MSETLEEFYERIRKETARMELEYLEESGADEERIDMAAERADLLPGDYMDMMVKKDG